MQRWESIHRHNEEDTCGSSCNPLTNDKQRLLEFAATNNLMLANTLGTHKLLMRWIWHSSGNQYHDQINYIMVPKRFQSGVNTTRRRSFLGADIGSDHTQVLMIFKVKLK